MVLRKPYAFFIKHFKLFHIILSALIIFSVIRMTNVISFINSYLNSDKTLITMDDVNNIYSIIDYIVPLVALAFSILLLVVMSMKKKPNKYYAYSTIFIIVVLILNIYGHNTLKTLTKEWLYANRISTLRDLYIFALLGSIIEVAIAVSRAIGFNVGRFDFNNDIIKLELSEKDNEEFELMVDFDINDLKRNTQKKVRYFKYFVKEYKNIIIWSFAIVILFIGAFIGFSYIKDKKKVISMNSFNSVINGFKMKINGTYIIDKDLSGKEFDDNKVLLVLDMTMTNTDKRNAKSFSSGSINITIDDESYYSTNKYENAVIDFGKIYTNTKIKADSSETRVFVFEIPKNRIKRTLLFCIKNLNTNEDTYVKLNPINMIDKDKEIIEKKIGETMDIDNNIIKDSSIKIDKYDIKNVFRIDYDYCINNSCLNSIEYLTAKNNNSNFDKYLLKLEGEYNFNKDNSINTLYMILNYYGYIEYKIGDNTYKENGIYGEVKSSKIDQDNIYYFEILSDIQKADNIILGFNVRNKEYRYILKGQGA